jgi:hypothetical protein
MKRYARMFVMSVVVARLILLIVGLVEPTTTAAACTLYQYCGYQCESTCDNWCTTHNYAGSCGCVDPEDETSCCTCEEI